MIKELKYIALEYTNKDIEYIEELTNYLEKETERVVEFFNIKNFENKVKIKLYDNIDTFREDVNKIIKRNVPDWMCGLSFNKEDNIEYIYTLSLEELRKADGHKNANLIYLEQVILHEFTHSCNSIVSKKLEVIWFVEGLATYVSGQINNKEILFTNDMTLDKMIDMNQGINYINYYSLFKYTYETYGYNYIMKLLKDNNLLKEVTPKLLEEAKQSINKKKNL